MNICWPIYFSTLCTTRLYFSSPLWGPLFKPMPVSHGHLAGGQTAFCQKHSLPVTVQSYLGHVWFYEQEHCAHPMCYDRANAQWGANVFSKSLFWNRWEDLKTCFGMISMHKTVRFLRHLISKFYNLKVIVMVNVGFSTGFKYQLPLIEPNLNNTSWVN